jgi:hypothetical protein
VRLFFKHSNRVANAEAAFVVSMAATSCGQVAPTGAREFRRIPQATAGRQDRSAALAHDAR